MCIATSAPAPCMGCCACAALPRTTRTSSAPRRRSKTKSCGCIEFAQLVLTTFGFKEFQVELSTWDPKDRKSYTGSDENWALAIRSLENALGRKAIPYKTIPRRSRLLRPQDRHQAGGRSGPPMAAVDSAIRLQSCRRALRWSMWAKTASVINRSWSIARSSGR